jgi:hypothetical protein
VRTLVWLLVPTALIGGAAAGYLARGSQTKTVTVVQIETTQAPPPATHKLTAVVRSKDGSCLATNTNYSDITQHTFVLRRPSNGVSDGDVVAVAQSIAYDGEGCDLNVVFKISPKLGFFVVHDDSAASGSWGPFDSSQMSARGWSLLLNESE